jgi:hypothetical protein
MFYLVAILGIVLMLSWVAVDRVIVAPRRSETTQSPAAPRLGMLEVGLYGLLMIGFLTLAVTGFVGYLTSGHVVGTLLIIHMMGGGLFATVQPVFMVTLAGAARLDRTGPGEPLMPGEKVLFWLGMAAGWVSLATVVLTMLPVFGTEPMRTLLAIHRYSGLAMVVLLIPHAYIMLTWRAAGVAPAKASALETK